MFETRDFKGRFRGFKNKEPRQELHDWRLREVKEAARVRETAKFNAFIALFGVHKSRESVHL